MLLLSIIAQALAIWTGVATVAALSFGRALGTLSAVPAPVRIPGRMPAPEPACENSAEPVGCGAGW
jgi:hypothetical protein